MICFIKIIRKELPCSCRPAQLAVWWCYRPASLPRDLSSYPCREYPHAVTAPRTPGSPLHLVRFGLDDACAFHNVQPVNRPIVRQALLRCDPTRRTSSPTPLSALPTSSRFHAQHALCAAWEAPATDIPPKQRPPTPTPARNFSQATGPRSHGLSTCRDPDDTITVQCGEAAMQLPWLATPETVLPTLRPHALGPSRTCSTAARHLTR